MTKKQRDRARFTRRDIRSKIDHKSRPNTFDVRQHALQHKRNVDTTLEPVPDPGGGGGGGGGSQPKLFPRVFRWTGTSADGLTGTSLTGYAGTAQGAAVEVEFPDTSSTMTFNLNLNGVSVATFTVLAGVNNSQIQNLDDIPFDLSDTWTFTQTTYGTALPNFYCWVWVSLDLTA